MSRRFSPAQPAIGPTDPDSAPARALVLVEDFSAGQGHWHLHRRAQLIHASQGVIHVHTQTGHWVVPPQRAVWIPPNTLHSVGSSWGYRLQTLYLDSKLPGLPRRAAVVPVSPLLEQLLAAVARLGGELLADDAAWWQAWREQQHAFFAGVDESNPLIRVSCKSTAAFGDLANGIDRQAIDWGGAQRWLRAQSIALPAIREWAREEGGNAHVFRGAVNDAQRVVPMPSALSDVQQKIKASFDPYNIFPPM